MREIVEKVVQTMLADSTGQAPDDFVKCKIPVGPEVKTDTVRCEPFGGVPVGPERHRHPAGAPRMGAGIMELDHGGPV